MPLTALAERRLWRLGQKGIGLSGDNSKIFDLARGLCDQIDAPVLGPAGVRLTGENRPRVSRPGRLRNSWLETNVDCGT